MLYEVITPTANLDADSATAVLGIMRRLAAQEQLTLLISTHDPRVFNQFEHIIHLSDRITSYNVCYTKLLRIQGLQEATSSEADKSTQINHTYWKLLNVVKSAASTNTQKAQALTTLSCNNRRGIYVLTSRQ